MSLPIAALGTGAKEAEVTLRTFLSGHLNETVSILGEGARRHASGDNISLTDMTTLEQAFS